MNELPANHWLGAEAKRVEVCSRVVEVLPIGMLVRRYSGNEYCQHFIARTAHSVPLIEPIVPSGLDFRVNTVCWNQTLGC